MRQGRQRHSPLPRGPKACSGATLSIALARTRSNVQKSSVQRGSGKVGRLTVDCGLSSFAVESPNKEQGTLLSVLSCSEHKALRCSASHFYWFQLSMTRSDCATRNSFVLLVSFSLAHSWSTSMRNSDVSSLITATGSVCPGLMAPAIFVLSDER